MCTTTSVELLLGGSAAACSGNFTCYVSCYGRNLACKLYLAISKTTMGVCSPRTGSVGASERASVVVDSRLEHAALVAVAVKHILALGDQGDQLSEESVHHRVLARGGEAKHSSGIPRE